MTQREEPSGRRKAPAGVNPQVPPVMPSLTMAGLPPEQVNVVRRLIPEKKKDGTRTDDERYAAFARSAQKDPLDVYLHELKLVAQTPDAEKAGMRAAVLRLNAHVNEKHSLKLPVKVIAGLTQLQTGLINSATPGEGALPIEDRLISFVRKALKNPEALAKAQKEVIKGVSNPGLNKRYAEECDRLYAATNEVFGANLPVEHQFEPVLPADEPMSPLFEEVLTTGLPADQQAAPLTPPVKKNVGLLAKIGGLFGGKSGKKKSLGLAARPLDDDDFAAFSGPDATPPVAGAWTKEQLTSDLWRGQEPEILKRLRAEKEEKKKPGSKSD